MHNRYKTLSIKDFGLQLLETQDLDPVYNVLTQLDWDQDKVKRWLLGYWCFYHCGIASWLSDFEDQYWFDHACNLVLNQQGGCPVEIPASDVWPRGKERRHFRGKKALDALQYVSMEFKRPEAAVDFMIASDTLEGITERVKTVPQFGPWIAFKIADMAERVLGYETEFQPNGVMMFKDPKEAALRLYLQLKEGVDPSLKSSNYLDWRPGEKERGIELAISHLEVIFSNHLAPPVFDRGVNIQEIETILCKWKSHCNGHYPFNNDIDEISHGLSDWAEENNSANDFLREMKRI